MPQCKKNTLLPYTPHQLYSLVNDTTSYPHFVPYCTEGQVLETHDWGVIASLTFTMMGVHTTLTTKNMLMPDKSIHMTLIHGPLQDLDGTWQFTETPHGTLITLDIMYQQKNGWLDTLSGPFIEKVILHMDTIFTQEAHRRYATEY